MSLYRQLWLALILTTVLAVIGCLLVSTLSTRAYLTEQLSLKNTDNATALALNLSRGGVDTLEIELTTSAMFDTGHYEVIRVTDPAGKPLVEHINHHAQQVPEWFAQLLPIAAPAGEALINDGWRQVGKITLQSHSRFAYAALWQSTILLILTLTFTGLLAGWLGTLILRRLKTPLDSVTQQAKAITERRFVTSPEPSVPELRQLSSAMNFAVTRLKAMFEEEAARLESVRKEANHDPVTGLANRRFFMAGLSSLLANPDAPGGSLMIIRLTRLSEMNQSLGRQNTDQVLHTVAQVLQQHARNNPDAIAARLNGPDFALLLPGETAMHQQAKSLLAALDETIRTHDAQASVYLGYGEYRQGMELSHVLAQVDNALAKAESSAQSAASASETTLETARGEAQWAMSLRRALDQGWTKLASFPVADFSGRLLHRECPLRLRLDEQGEWHSAGLFLPMARRLETTGDIDLAAVAHALEELGHDQHSPGIAVNLSGYSLARRGFKQRLIALLDSHPQAAQRLWMEVAEADALAHLAEFEEFCRDAKERGCLLGVEHCGNQSGQLGRFHGLPLDYLKVDARFIRDIDQHEGNQLFLKGLASMAHGIGLQVIAEGVVTEAERATLQELGLDGATGPGIKE